MLIIPRSRTVGQKADNKWLFLATTCHWGPEQWPDVWGGNQWLSHSPAVGCRCFPNCNRPGPPLLCPSGAWPAAESSWGRKQRRRETVKECVGWERENDSYLPLSFLSLLQFSKGYCPRLILLCKCWCQRLKLLSTSADEQLHVNISVVFINDCIVLRTLFFLHITKTVTQYKPLSSAA